MSVINQTYKNSELIIIDDESIDKSPNIIIELINKIYLSKKIKSDIQDSMGLSKTLNKSIKMANGELIAFLASDDMYLPKSVS